MVAALSVVQSLPVPHWEAGRAWLLISGVKKSSTPLPDGPSNIWYAGCLSDQAVRSPWLCATLKIVLTSRYWLGVIGLHVAGSTTIAAGLRTSFGLLVICRMLPGSPARPWPASS